MSSSKNPNSSPSIHHLVSSSCISCPVFKPPSFAEPLPICVRGCTLHSPQDAQHRLNLRCIPGPNRGRQQPWGDSRGRDTINSQQPLMYVVYTSLYICIYLYMYHRIWQVVSEDVRQLLSEHQHLQKKGANVDCFTYQQPPCTTCLGSSSSLICRSLKTRKDFQGGVHQRWAVWIKTKKLNQQIPGFKHQWNEVGI